MPFAHINILIDKAKAKVRFPAKRVDLETPSAKAREEFAKKYHSAKEGENPVREGVLIALFKNPVDKNLAPALVPDENSLVLLGKHSKESWWAAEKFVPIGGVMQFSDFDGAKTLGQAFSNALLREAEEELGIKQSQFSHSYTGSFYFKKHGYVVHAYSGFLHCDPEQNCEDHHVSQVMMCPANPEHDCCMWLPAQHALSSPQVHPLTKHVIRLAIKAHKKTAPFF